MQIPNASSTAFTIAKKQGINDPGKQKLFFNHEPHEKAWRGLIAHNPFFVHGKHGKLGKFCRVAALTDEPALPKFLCVKVGFTFSVGGDMERRRLAGMKPVSLSHH
jgi:hypothetical protein